MVYDSRIDWPSSGRFGTLTLSVMRRTQVYNVLTMGATHGAIPSPHVTPPGSVYSRARCRVDRSMRPRSHNVKVYSGGAALAVRDMVGSV